MGTIEFMAKWFFALAIIRAIDILLDMPKPTWTTVIGNLLVGTALLLVDVLMSLP